jgi:hypothetical protein
MKNFLIAAWFFLPFFASTQDTCGLKKSTDPFTHQTKISTGFIAFPFGKSPLSISVDATPTDIDFFLWFTGDQKCFDESSNIQIVFEGDRLKSNFRNTGSMNCEGAFHITFKNSANTPPMLQRLLDKKINAFHITGPNKTLTDIVFTQEQKDRLIRMINCVVKESKSILKK